MHNSDVRVGYIVMVSTFPYTRWLVKEGKYIYNGEQRCGMYLESLMDGSTIPLDSVGPDTITVVSTSCCPCLPGPPYPPFPPSPGEDVSRAWIVVDTIEARDALDPAKLPMGKIVRVNYTTQGVKYYIWNQLVQQWDIWNFASPEELNKAVQEEIEAADIPGQVEDAMQDSEILHGVVSEVVAEETAALTGRVEHLENITTGLNAGDVAIIKAAIEWTEFVPAGDSDTGLGWVAKTEWLKSEANTKLAEGGGRTFTKYDNGYTLAWFQPDTLEVYPGPVLMSTSYDAAVTYVADGIRYPSTIVINDVTWYVNNQLAIRGCENTENLPELNLGPTPDYSLALTAAGVVIPWPRD